MGVDFIYECLLGHNGTQSGNGANSLQRGSFLANTKVNMLRFPSGSRPFPVHLLGRKGKGQRFFLTPVSCSPV